MGESHGIKLIYNYRGYSWNTKLKLQWQFPWVKKAATDEDIRLAQELFYLAKTNRMRNENGTSWEAFSHFFWQGATFGMMDWLVINSGIEDAVYDAMGDYVPEEKRVSFAEYYRRVEVNNPYASFFGGATGTIVIFLAADGGVVLQAGWNAVKITGSMAKYFVLHLGINGGAQVMNAPGVGNVVYNAGAEMAQVSADQVSVAWEQVLALAQQLGW